MENKRKMHFLRTQRRIASSGIEPRVGSLSIINSMLYQQNYRRRNLRLMNAVTATTKLQIKIAKNVFFIA